MTHFSFKRTYVAIDLQPQGRNDLSIPLKTRYGGCHFCATPTTLPFTRVVGAQRVRVCAKCRAERGISIPQELA